MAAVVGDESRSVSPARSDSRRFWASAIRNWKIRIGGSLVLLLVVAALFGPSVAPHDFRDLAVGPQFAPPSWDFPFGTDLHGRDMFSRLLQGARLALGLPLVVAAMSLVIALPLGVLAGYRHNRVSSLTMAGADLLLSIPWILVALVVVSYRGPGLGAVVITLPLVFAAPIIRIARSSVSETAGQDYVLAAHGIGESEGAILLRYILRNAYFPILVLVTSQLGYALLIESAISYLGLGVQSPLTSWGVELASGTQYVAAGPHLVIFPGLLIAITVMGFNFLGDGLGDLFDARREE